MKKFYLFAMLAMTAMGIQAQTLLDEDFETTSTESYSTPIGTLDGWSTVDSYSGTQKDFNWVNYYSSSGVITGSGKHCATCDGPTSSYYTDGVGPREEILLSPELKLDNTYQLSFTWVVSPMAFQTKSLYDLQVRIVEGDDVDDAETIFSIQSEEDLKESGIVGSISGWTPYTSKLDLSEWQGKTIKIAFVYKMLTSYANSAYLDAIKVEQHNFATTPVASLNTTRYNYGEVYIGEKFYSEAIRLTNTGKKGLKIESIDLPQGVAINIDPTTVNLDNNEYVDFQLSYTASLTSPASATATIHTNGGDVAVDLSATKLSIPDGMSEETFEGYFPPAGWTNKGWTAATYAIEGDASAYSGVNIDATYLTSPRLDLTSGGTLKFTYYNQFDSEDGGTYQENDITVEVSTDGGKTWEAKWTFDYDNDEVQNKLITETVDLGMGTDNSYVRFHNTAVNYDTDSGAGEGANFYLDRVFLPNVYGLDGVPGTATLVAPKDSLTDVYPKAIKLEWAPAQFATGYKLYVGTSSAVNELVNGTDLGNTLSYTLASAPYETMVYWKVVPYNAKGDNANAPVWHFTTQKDASVHELPYSEDFTGVKTLPEGWTSANQNAGYAEGETGYSNRNWSVNSIYGNEAPCLNNMWLPTGGTAWVATPEFTLPAGKEVRISFDWVDTHVSNAVKDESGLLKKENLTPDNGTTKVTFEVNADGAWKELSYLSTAVADSKYWLHETIDLSEYAGQTVQFRWMHYGLSGTDRGAGLDNVLLEVVESDKAEFNKAEWKAGKVNYGKAVNSGDQFSIINRGSQTLKVKSVSFDSANFTSSLAAGTEIPVGEGVKFNIQFNALQTAGEVGDEMVVTFESGYTVSFPVEGEALAEDVRYYSFEDNTLDYQWTDDFTLIDVDGVATCPFNCYGTEFPQNGGVYAFAVAYERPNHDNVAPISGDAFLIPGSPYSEDTKGDNWIVSQKLAIKSGATFDFYCRNWESNQSIIPDAKHKVQVLVSETSNTDRTSFTALLSEEIPFLDREDWQHYTVGLSAYAGKEIYVAVRDYNDAFALAAFYDDFTFTHVGQSATSIQTINSEISDNALVSVYNVNGVQVAQGTGISTLRSLQKGIYVVKVSDGTTVKTLRVARK